MGGGFQRAFSTRCWYRVFHKPVVMGMDWNVLTVVFVTHSPSGGSSFTLCCPGSSPGFQKLLSGQKRLYVNGHWGHPRQLSQAVCKHHHLSPHSCSAPAFSLLLYPNLPPPLDLCSPSHHSAAEVPGKSRGLCSKSLGCFCNLLFSNNWQLQRDLGDKGP